MSKSLSQLYFWLRLLAFSIFFFVIVGFVIIQHHLNILEHPVTPPEILSNYYVDDNGNLARGISVEQGLLSEGWTKECVSSINVSKYKFVDEYRDYGCGQTILIEVCDTADVNSHCDYRCGDGRIVDLSNFTIAPAHVDYYNESVCTKFVLVKYNGDGFNG